MGSRFSKICTDKSHKTTILLVLILLGSIVILILNVLLIIWFNDPQRNKLIFQILTSYSNLFLSHTNHIFSYQSLISLSSLSSSLNLSHWLHEEGIVTEYSSINDIKRQAAFRALSYIPQLNKIHSNVMDLNEINLSKLIISSGILYQSILAKKHLFLIDNDNDYINQRIEFNNDLIHSSISNQKSVHNNKNNNKNNIINSHTNTNFNNIINNNNNTLDDSIDIAMVIPFYSGDMQKIPHWLEAWMTHLPCSQEWYEDQQIQIQQQQEPHDSNTAYSDKHNNNNNHHQDQNQNQFKASSSSSSSSSSSFPRQPMIKVHFIWAYSGDFHSSEGRLIKKQLDYYWQLYSQATQCFHSVLYISLHQPDSFGHLDGACITFQTIMRIFKNTKLQAFQLMETDVWPIKKNWLQHFITFSDIQNVCHNWWVKGSLSLCNTIYSPPLSLDDRLDFHINRNSLYALNCQPFQQFLVNIQKFYPPQKVYAKNPYKIHQTMIAGGCDTADDNSGGYDHVMYQYRLAKENYAYSRTIISKFQYTSFVANFCEDIYIPSEILQQHPHDMYLIHSKSIFYHPDVTAVLQYYNIVFYGRTFTDEAHYFFLKALSMVYSGELDINAHQQQQQQQQQQEQQQQQQLLLQQQPQQQQLFSNSSNSSTNNNNNSGSSNISGNSSSSSSSSNPNQISSSSSSQRFDISLLSQEWKSFPPHKYYLWTTDFHAGPIVCNMPIFRDLGYAVHAEIDDDDDDDDGSSSSSTCRSVGYCKQRLKVLEYNHGQGLSLENNNNNHNANANPNHQPEMLIQQFYNTYKDDEEMLRVNAFICSYPTANCQLFLPFRKPIIIYATTRLEFGRNDENVVIRQPYHTHEKGEEMWKKWVSDLQLLASSSHNIIAANNLYDVHYIQYFTGISTIHYLPSWCGDVNYAYNCLRTHQSLYKPKPLYIPTKNSFLLGPYRSPLEILKNGENKMKNFESHYALIQQMQKMLKLSFTTATTTTTGTNDENQFKIELMQNIFKDSSSSSSSSNQKGHDYNIHDICRYLGIIIIPTQVSDINIIEYYRLNIPLFFPTQRLLLSWYKEYDVMWSRVYGHPKRYAVNDDELNRTTTTTDNDYNTATTTTNTTTTTANNNNINNTIYDSRYLAASSSVIGSSSSSNDIDNTRNNPENRYRNSFSNHHHHHSNPASSSSLSSSSTSTTATASRTIPNPNDDTYESFKYWIQYCDWYNMPHIQLFSSMGDLIQKLHTVDLQRVSRKMKKYNDGEKVRLKKEWKTLLDQAIMGKVEE